MSGIFDGDSDNEIDIKPNNEYAKKYDSWRQKEVIQKLKDRYGDADGTEDSSSSDDEDEDAKELTEQIEKDFFKTLSFLKKKDPSIYDKEVRFFKAADASKEVQSKRKRSPKPLLLRDVERNLIVERGGMLSDEEENPAGRSTSPTFVEEQEAIKKSFKTILEDSDEEESAWGGLFESRKKTTDELTKENEDYHNWLNGQQAELKDKNVETDLKHLHDFWNDPKLDSNEAFLKDYILNRKFLDAEDKSHVPTYDEIVHDSDEDLSEDGATVAKQEEFEQKFNFRFEEPDQEFIKRYPRTMENSIRRPDTRRKEKREEIKERKASKKERMREDLMQLKALKRKEILEKIEKLKQITGNDCIGFQDKDIEGDFDPDKHDERMNELFTDEYYGGKENDQKPEFPELDEELELEEWDNWNGQGTNQNDGNYELNCEDPNFNMDCDYNPTLKFQAELIETTTKKKKGRKSKLAQALAKKKPLFDPNDHTFEQYVDEYYAMDFEDVIGDLPCRFKYRNVMPNSFGLSIDEILKANDKELNQWCSLKKTVQHRPEYAEKEDLYKYQRQAKNTKYKMRVLTSLYNDEKKQPQEEVQKKKKKKKSKKAKKVQESLEDQFEINMPKSAVMDVEINASNNSKMEIKTETSEKPVPKKRKISVDKHSLEIENPVINESKKRKLISIKNEGIVIETEASTSSEQTERKKKKKKVIQQTTKNVNDISINSTESSDVSSRRKRKNMKLALKKKEILASSASKLPQLPEMKKRNKKQGAKDKTEPVISISDARLKAYGLHPKKFKNYLKYGKTEK